MSKKFSWNSALGSEAKKEKEPSWVKSTPEEILTRTLVNMFEKKNERPKRFDGYYHPSQIYDMCVVQEYFRRKLKVDLYDEAGMFNRLIMGAGTAAHKYFQEHVFGPAKLILGDWLCQLCGNIITVKDKMPNKCNKCGARSPHIIYLENEVLNEDLKIRGQVDGIMDIKGIKDKYLLEMKSRGTDSYNNFIKPYPREIMQVNIYMHLLDLKNCAFTYICRENYDYKFYLVEKNSSIVKKAFDKIDLVENGLEKDTVPMKDGVVARKCRKKNSAVAKKCPFYKQCWS